ncbi:hypothetical protein PISMIDRAFT_681887, partial [Pisolithus microcarpus 441]
YFSYGNSKEAVHGHEVKHIHRSINCSPPPSHSHGQVVFEKENEKMERHCDTSCTRASVI